MAENWLVAGPRVDHTLWLGVNDRGTGFARGENWLVISDSDDHTLICRGTGSCASRVSESVNDKLKSGQSNEKFSGDWLVAGASDNHTLMWFRWLIDKVWTLSTFHRQKWTFANSPVKVCDLSLFIDGSGKCVDFPFCRWTLLPNHREKWARSCECKV